MRSTLRRHARTTMAALAAGAVAALVLAAPAAAGKYVSVPGVQAGGPAGCQRSYVEKFGPSRARNVLVLAPGFLGGAGSLSYVGEQLGRKVRGLQVWAWDRRTACLEDPTGLDAARRARSGDPIASYYFFGQSINGKRYAPATQANSGFVSGWGVNTQLGDLRKVIRAARKGKRRVFLGGHSMGGSITGAYAAYDFGGRPGYRDVAGLVFIDGGESLKAPDATQVNKAIADANSKPFNDLLGAGLPWATGAFADLGGANARFAPRTAVPASANVLLAAAPAFKPPFVASNETALGYATNPRVNPKAFSFISVGNGHPAASGTPRQWVSDGLVPIQAQARAFFREPAGFAEWFSAAKLPAELGAIADLSPTPLAARYGLKPKFRKQVNVPAYFFEAALTHPSHPGRAWRKRTRSKTTIVDRPDYEHLDPILAQPRNAFLSSVARWLKPKLKR